MKPLLEMYNHVFIWPCFYLYVFMIPVMKDAIFYK